MATTPRLRIALTVLVLTLLVTSLAAGCAAPATQAPTPVVKYPERPIEVIVAGGIGGTLDTQTRLVLPYLQKNLGGSFVVTTVPAAGGRAGRAQAFSAKPDGYTILASAFPSIAIGEILYGGTYSTTSFVPIGSFMGQDFTIIAVKDDSKIKTLADFVNATKQKPLKVGTAGAGVSDDMAGRLFKAQTGLNFDLVPFNGSAEQVMALMGDKVDAVMDSVSGAAQRKEFTVLVQFGAKRHELLPDVPTLVESGYKTIDIGFNAGLFGVPGFPDEYRKTIETALQKAVADPEYVAKIKAGGALPLWMNSADFKVRIQNDYKLVKDNEKLLLTQ